MSEKEETMSAIQGLEVTVAPRLYPWGEQPNTELRARIKSTHGEYSIVKQVTPEEFDTKGLFDIIWEYAGRLLKAELERQLSDAPESESNP